MHIDEAELWKQTALWQQHEAQSRWFLSPGAVVKVSDAHHTLYKMSCGTHTFSSLTDEFSMYGDITFTVVAIVSPHLPQTEALMKHMGSVDVVEVRTLLLAYVHRIEQPRKTVFHMSFPQQPFENTLVWYPITDPSKFTNVAVLA